MRTLSEPPTGRAGDLRTSHGFALREGRRFDLREADAAISWSTQAALRVSQVTVHRLIPILCGGPCASCCQPITSLMQAELINLILLVAIPFSMWGASTLAVGPKLIWSACPNSRTNRGVIFYVSKVALKY